MSFDLFVYAPPLPANLIPLWEAALARYWLICSFYPGFHPITTHDSFVPIQVRVVPDAFPLADRYGAASLYAELEVYCEDVAGEYFAEWRARAFQYAPATLHPYLEQAACCLYFRTAAGRTLIEFRLQYFAAATLAILTNGLVDDPQTGCYLVGADAIQKATAEADTYEARADPDDWQLPLFTGWPSPPITALQRES
jgi:hypothetical protein